jgi:hypothetical protein
MPLFCPVAAQHPYLTRQKTSPRNWTSIAFNRYGQVRPSAVESGLQHIILFSTWAFEVAGSICLDRIGSDLSVLVNDLESTKWVHELLSRAGVPLTKRHAVLIEVYMNDPKSTLKRLFRFDEPGFREGEMIDVFPPESFFLGRQ